MAGKRQNDVNMVATKGDIVKDIIADVVSQEIHKQTGIACTKRENMEIRLNLIKLEDLVKEYDLNNPAKETEFYDKGDGKVKKLYGVNKLTCYQITKEDIDLHKTPKEKAKELAEQQAKSKRKKKRKKRVVRKKDESI